MLGRSWGGECATAFGVRIRRVAKRKNLPSVFKNFQIGEPIQLNSVTVCDFFKLIISITDSHCDYSPQAPKNLAMPVTISLFCWVNPLFETKFKCGQIFFKDENVLVVSHQS